MEEAFNRVVLDLKHLVAIIQALDLVEVALSDLLASRTTVHQTTEIRTTTSEGEVIKTTAHRMVEIIRIEEDTR